MWARWESQLGAPPPVEYRQWKLAGGRAARFYMVTFLVMLQSLWVMPVALATGTGSARWALVGLLLAATFGAVATGTFYMVRYMRLDRAGRAGFARYMAERKAAQGT